MGALEDAIALAIKAQVARLNFEQVLTGTVKEVGETTCTVERTDAPTIYEVRLNAIDDDLQSYVTIYPVVGSSVIVGIIEGLKTEAVVLRCSEVVQVKMKIGEQTVKIDKDGVVFNDGAKGLAKVDKLTEKINALESDINKLKTAFATWVTVPSDGGAALKLITATWFGSALSVTTQAQLEDSKIKH